MMFTENTANNGSHVNCKEVNPHAPGTVRRIHPPGPLGARLHVPAEVPDGGTHEPAGERFLIYRYRESLTQMIWILLKIF